MNKYDEALRVVLSHRSGRHVLWRLLEQTGFFAVPPKKGAKYAGGQRSVGAFLFDAIKKVDASTTLTMIKEEQEGLYD